MANQPQNPKPPPPQPPKLTTATTKPFTYWAYFTISISLLTLLLSQLYTTSPNNPNPFISLPQHLLHHHSKGKLIKTHLHPSTPLNIFAIELGPQTAPSVLLLHGLASSSFSFRHLLPPLSSSGFRAVAIDLPGSGFSDNLPVAHDIPLLALPFRRILDIYTKIRDKGIFWGFEQLVETGGITYEEDRIRSPELGYGPGEIARVVEQVVESLGLEDIHLVLHDSALVPGMNFVAWNKGLVRSVSLIDSAAGLPAFPSMILGAPVVGGLVLRSKSLFGGLLRLCCSRYIDVETAEAYRLLVKGKDEGRRAVVEAGKALNLSFDLGQWMQSELARDVPLQVLWSNTWSDRWIDEGKKVAIELPMANFSYHSGGRWPQEDASEELANKIIEFVSSLPKLSRQTIQEPQSQKAENFLSDHEHHDHYHGFGHGNEYGADIYGLDM